MQKETIEAILISKMLFRINMPRIEVKDLHKIPETENVVIYGWMQEIRVLKNVIFIILRDHTGTAQVTIRKNELSNAEEISTLNRESVIKVEGKLVKNTISKLGLEILATSIEVLNEADAPLPLGIIDPVEADFDTRLNNRFLDVRKPEKSLIFKIESSVLWGIREYLREMNFVEVHTPKIVASATEGGADLFRVKYFEKEAFLNQSPQLYKEILISSGLNRVFEVGPAFRAEEHNTPRHLNEFTSIDIEMSFADHNDAMEMLENVIRKGIEKVKNDLGEEMSNLGLELKVPELPFPRIKYEECREILKEKGMELPFGEDFSPDQLREIGNRFKGFYFITDWPASLRPFYTMPKPEDPKYTNSFDLQFNEKEITSGAQRVHNPKMLQDRFLEKGLNPDDFEFYIKAFRYGMPPHAGWAIGLERLVMILLDLSNIRDATLFPRDRTRIVP